MDTIRDRMWAWGHTMNAHRQGWGIEADSKMTPAGGADYLGVPNILIVLPPSEKEASEVIRFRRIVWQLTLQQNFDFSRDLKAIQSLAQAHRNIEGVILDDLTSIEIGQRGMKPEVLAQLCYMLQGQPRPLSLWGVLYTMNFDIPRLADYLNLLDVVTLWTWVADDLDQLESNFECCEKLVGGKPVVQGLYMYDYGQKRPMPVDRMKFQCEKALSWVKQRRIVGMIFLATCITDLGFEAVEWTRNWIKEIGKEAL